MRVVIKTGFSKARIESFYKFHMRHISNGRFIEIIMMIVSFIIGLLGIFVFEELIVTIIALLFTLIVAATYSYRVYYATKRAFKKNPMDNTTYTVIITDNDVSFIKEDLTTSIFKWNEIRNVCEIDECFYLYVTPSTAIIIPKFTINIKDKEALINLFKEKSKYQKYKFISAIDEEGVV